MEIRNVVIAGGAVLAMGVLGLSVYEPQERGSPRVAARTLEQQPPAEPAAAPEPGTEDIVNGLLPMLASEDGGQRREGALRVGETLAGGKSRELTEETREKLAQMLVTAYGKTGTETPEDHKLRETLAGVIVGTVGGEIARGFAAEALDKDTDTVKVEVVKALTLPGAARGKAVFAKALELVKSGAVPEEYRAAVIRKALGRKSEDELLALFHEDLGPKGLKATAVELQNLGKPELMGVVLARLEETGLLKDAGRMPWISGRLLSEHIRSAKSDELVRALAVAKSRHSLTRSTAKALKERLADPDPVTRGMVARTIPQAVGNKGLDPESGEEMLVARLKEESDTAVKGAIEDSLAQVRQAKPATEAPKPEEPQPQQAQ